MGIPFKENDSLGGKDPYSSSKAAVEVLVASYNSSFPIFQHRISLSTARAGNVIGGGDWLQNRIVPDLMKAYAKSDSLHLRNPGSVRPWQHVLDALSGYLLQAEYFSTQSTQNDVRAFNFGPSVDSQITVAGLIDEFSKYLQIKKPSIDYSEKKLEAGVLSLDSSLARSQLGWVPTMNFTDSVHATASWYKAYLDGDNPFEVSSQQVINWLTDAD
jgi:CDP-glucose 4,6-dehydratase